MRNYGLLFIPDISGFTKFVNETEISHSRIIIEELLGNIINSNRMGLQISEVEGDAVLFYRYGDNPSFEEISSQVEKMFCNFQRQIKTYEQSRMCECAACTNAVHLSLKIISHYGEFSSYTVKDYKKLIGKDVIVAHQLLKNDINLHEYWLVTDNLFSAEKNNDALPEWIEWQTGNKQTDTGEIKFDYSMLTSLKENIEPAPVPDYTLGENKMKVAGATKIIDAPLITVFSTMGNLSVRNQWQANVKEIDQQNHPVYHLGSRFRSITDKNKTVYYSSSFNKNDDSISMSETDERKTHSIYITLQAVSENQTSVTFELFLPKKASTQILFTFFKKKNVEKSFKQSLKNLEQLLK